MNHERMKNEPGLVCTCNDIYREAIEEEVEAGCEDAEELMYSIPVIFVVESVNRLLSGLLPRSQINI